MDKKSNNMTIIEHLSELRRRFILVLITILLATIICFLYASPILDHLSRGITLIYIRPSEAFMAHFHLAVSVGVFASTPLIFYQIVAFMLPALYGKEKRVLLAAGIPMFLLFCLGLAFAWFVVFPYAMDFFASFAGEKLLPWYTVSEYVSFVTMFLLAFGLVFQSPLIFWVLGALALVSSRFLRKSRKYALVVILILAAFLTPPDVVSQILMAVPMLGLYELGIFLVIIAEARRKKRTQALVGEE